MVLALALSALGSLLLFSWGYRGVINPPVFAEKNKDFQSVLDATLCSDVPSSSCVDSSASHDLKYMDYIVQDDLLREKRYFVDEKKQALVDSLKSAAKEPKSEDTEKKESKKTKVGFWQRFLAWVAKNLLWVLLALFLALFKLLFRDRSENRSKKNKGKRK